MSHSLVVGMTESGKTTLATRMSDIYKKAGIPVLVLDTFMDSRWSADFITDDIENFLWHFWRSKNCAVFIDESAEAIGRYNQVMIQTATKGRHWGHNCHYITQRGQDLN